MQTTLNKFISTLSDNISNNPKLKQIRADVNKKVNREITKIKNSIKPETVKTWHKAEKKYNDFVKKINIAQKQMDQELKKALVSVKKSAVEVEKTLNHFKNLALKQKQQSSVITKKPRSSAVKKSKVAKSKSSVAKKRSAVKITTKTKSAV
jgi:hypothetical protein